MKLKVCGITSAAFAVEAAKRGVDYLGLIFAAKSPRRATAAQAREIVAAVSAASSPAPRFVGVFVEHSAQAILEIAGTVPISVIQLHSRNYGADDVALLKAAGYEIWALDGSAASASAASKGTVPICNCKNERECGKDGKLCPVASASADAILLDGRDGARCGGTGKLADWSRIAELKAESRRVVLAGGLSAANIAEAAATGADILDVNSGVETAPGAKSIPLLDELLDRYSAALRQMQTRVRP